MATKTSAQLSFLEQASRRVDRGEASGMASDASDPLKTGVVFVHGIGSQAPGETLLAWATPLIDLLTSLRVAAGAVPADPVVRAEMNFSDGLGAIELRVPPSPGSDDERTWVLTEAWWASRVSPPSLSTMTTWLGPRNAAARIVEGILANPAGMGVLTGGLVRFARVILVPFVSVLAAVVLTIYTLFRGVSGLIPIASVRDSAVLKAFDGFLTGWFGDVRVLLYDPAQSANIRGALARTVRGLREVRCSSVVVVAHSGGCIVSYLALTDPSLADVQVEKLITHGEAWNLALQLSPRPDPKGAPTANDGWGMPDRLRRDITASQPNLRWRDFWATNDPAPSGELRITEIGHDEHPRIRSGKVWNRRSLVDDHGTYWTNEEEFVIPVLQEIDVPTGWGEDSMFFRPDRAAEPARTALAASPAPAAIGTPTATAAAASAAPSPAAAASAAPSPAAPPPPNAPAGPLWPPPFGVTPGPRAARHRQRVAALALLRQITIALPVALIAFTLALKPGRLVEIGRDSASVIGVIPGVSLLNGPIQWLHSLHDTRIHVGSEHLGFDLISAMEFIGIATLQAIVLIAIAQLLVAPVRAYQAWPKRAVARVAAALVEAVLFGLLFAGLIAIAAGTHHELLGAGADWIPGLVLTVITGAGAWGLSKIVNGLRSPGATRAFGAIAAAFFVTTMLSAVVAIFEPAGLPNAEVGYLTIWAAAILVYQVGRARWQNWDRLEQEIAKGAVADQPVNRWPAYLAAAGVVIAAIGATLAVFFRPDELVMFHLGIDPFPDVPLVAALAGVGILFFIASYAFGTGASRNARDPIAAPDPVGSSSW